MLTGDVPFKGENQVAVAMKHVRDELPDIQIRRPEVSAALAAVLDRATAKELDRRYPDAQTMISDLEQVLAIETARHGQVTGEATTVLRSLPSETQRRLPLRARKSTKALLGLLLLGVAVAAGIALLAAGQTERGTGNRSGVPLAPGAPQPVNLKQRAPADYDPIGADGEHPEQASAVVDGIASSTWSTESYEGGKLNKAGVGLVIDAAPKVAATELEIRTPTPGFQATIYVAPSSIPSQAPPAGGWTKVSGENVAIGSDDTIQLDTAGNAYRRYLVWITKLPPGQQSAKISEILLFR
jgi:serine/threonine-protein kinase